MENIVFNFNGKQGQIKTWHYKAKIDDVKMKRDNLHLVIFVKGKEATSISFQNDRETLPSQLSDRGINTASFEWVTFYHNNNIADFWLLNCFVKQVEAVIKYYKVVHNYKKVSFVTNSFGSFPVSLFIKQNPNCVDDIIFRGPVFSTSVNEFRFVLKNKYNEFPSVFDESIESLEKREMLINSFKNIENSEIDNLAINGKGIIFIGEAEIGLRLDDVNSFLRYNPNFEIEIFENATHLIYEPNFSKDDPNYKETKMALVNKQFNRILEILN